MSKYRLVEKTSKQLDTFKVVIVADSNDGDYITETMYYTVKDFNAHVIDALIDLQKNYNGSHQLENYPNNGEWLEIPFNGWDGYCHSLSELIVEYIDENGKIYDVEF
jgi:hypothetical protein